MSVMLFVTVSLSSLAEGVSSTGMLIMSFAGAVSLTIHFVVDLYFLEIIIASLHFQDLFLTLGFLITLFNITPSPEKNITPRTLERDSKI